MRGSAALDNELVIEVEPGRFEEMVITALDGLPEELGQLMRNVTVTVEHRPGPLGLLGLYQGIQALARDHRSAQFQAHNAAVRPRHVVTSPRSQDGFYDLGSWQVEAFGRLSSDLSYKVEVLIEVQHREPGEFGRCGDDQIGD